MQTHHIKKQKIILMIFVFIITTIGYTQKIAIPDSLQTKTVDELESLVLKNAKNSTKASFYAEMLLLKAKKEKDTLGLAKGYFQVSFNYSKPLKSIAYLDSSIAVSGSINHNKYPILAYLNRALSYEQLKNYDKVLDNNMTALELAEKTNNIYLNDIKHNIARLKDYIGEYEESNEIYKQIKNHEDSISRKGDGPLNTVFLLARSYRKLNKLDSASIYNKEGIRRALKDSFNIYYSFVLHEGITLYQKKEYTSALDSINKALSHIKKNKRWRDIKNTLDGFLHLSKTYNKLDSTSMFLKSLQEIDQIYDKTQYTSDEVREAYELLVNYYKSKNDKNKQLFFLNKLLKIDSTLHINYKNLNRKIVFKYDTPKLLSEKEKLISLLETKQKKSSNKFLMMVLLTCVLIVTFGYVYYKNYQYKKRFRALMSLEKEKTDYTKTNSSNNLSSNVLSDIPEEIVNNILKQLNQFEEKNEFLSPNLTVNILAKKLKTNSKYLSKVLNTKKQKRFNVYINELRVNYAIDQLKINPKFRLYSIKGIAHELGYNNDRAFSKAFYQKTGVHPSYFIKKLEKEKL
ncbi:AraC family transcriptional regulator [uncultured Aquimarina sp.]|uniref:AraC family transcriptional regulator n=1 Tax=uncultured Aquimarina sp. TaxID=575652 RepID=UPI00261CFC52|nr:AraC family transcriptional regulator [uncultured Aquimarina sp.]